MTGTMELLMAETEQPPAVPPHGTVRIDGELLEMARVVCFHTRTTAGARMKLAAYIDAIVRSRITEDYARVMAEQTGRKKK